jgi:hypothetical protein
VFGLLLLFVILVMVSVYVLSPGTIIQQYNKTIDVNVEDSTPHIRHKARRDWNELETEVKRIHHHSKPAHVKHDIISTLHTETPAQ